MKKTLIEVMTDVLKSARKPLTGKEIFEVIEKEKLFHFKSATPGSIVNSQLRRHSDNIKLPASSGNKLFHLTDDGKFKLL